MTSIGLAHYLMLSALLFSVGAFGIFLNRRNAIVALMSIELLLLAANLNLAAFSAYHQDLAGQVLALFALTVAAGEAAVGLALLVSCMRAVGSIDIDRIARLRENPMRNEFNDS